MLPKLEIPVFFAIFIFSISGNTQSLKFERLLDVNDIKGFEIEMISQGFEFSSKNEWVSCQEIVPSNPKNGRFTRKTVSGGSAASYKEASGFDYYECKENQSASFSFDSDFASYSVSFSNSIETSNAFIPKEFRTTMNLVSIEVFMDKNSYQKITQQLSKKFIYVETREEEGTFRSEYAIEGSDKWVVFIKNPKENFGIIEILFHKKL